MKDTKLLQIYMVKKVEIYHNKPLSIIQILHQNFENFHILVTLIRIIQINNLYKLNGLILSKYFK